MKNSLSEHALGKSRWYILSAIVLSLLFLYLAIRGVRWSEFISALLNCKVEYLVPAVVIILSNFIFRSQRWGILIRGDKPVSVTTLFWATGAGYLGNNFLPFRTGEVIRSVALGQKVGISKVYIFATAITERIIDAVFLIFLALVLMPTLSKTPDWLISAMWVMTILAFIGIITLLFATRLENLIISVINRIPLPLNWRASIIKNLKKFLQGAISFQKPQKAILFFLLTCLIWLLDGIGMMITGKAFSLELQLSQSLFLLVGLGLSSAIPSTPGYLGIYQFVAVTILGIYGYYKSQALAFILVAQVIAMLMTLIWGLIGLWRLGIHPTELKGGELQNKQD